MNLVHKIVKFFLLFLPDLDQNSRVFIFGQRLHHLLLFFQVLQLLVLILQLVRSHVLVGGHQVLEFCHLLLLPGPLFLLIRLLQLLQCFGRLFLIFKHIVQLE